VLHLDVSNIGRALHMGCTLKVGRGASGPHRSRPPGGCVKSRHGRGREVQARVGKRIGTVHDTV
jgi:hypothetical protein